MTLEGEILIKQIEIALGFELYDWQKLYILTGKRNPPNMGETVECEIKCKHLSTFSYNHGYHTICNDCGEEL